MFNKRLIVFTDLDASLLDHRNYTYDAAKPALDRLRHHNIPLIMNSSKTYPEMNELRIEMGIMDPFIIENGAAIIVPEGYFDNTLYEQRINLFNRHPEIIRLLNYLKGKGFQFRHFSTMEVDDIVEVTGLSNRDAAKAKERAGSEPLLWDDTPEHFTLFQKEIKEANLKLVQGGRFHHVTGHFDKGTAVSHLLQLYSKQHPYETFRSIGLGDSPNDLPMLKTVDHAIIIASRHIDEMRTSNIEAIYSAKPGPEGWNDTLTQLLNEYGL